MRRLGAEAGAHRHRPGRRPDHILDHGEASPIELSTTLFAAATGVNPRVGHESVLGVRLRRTPEHVDYYAANASGAYMGVGASDWRSRWYCGVIGSNSSNRIDDIRDGATNTILLGEIRTGMISQDPRVFGQ